MSGKIRVVAFDVEGFLAHFRCFYTTASRGTYLFPPRNTVAGMLAAILGHGNEIQDGGGYYGVFSRSNCRIAVRVMHPLRKMVISENLLDTGSRGRAPGIEKTDQGFEIEKIRQMMSRSRKPTPIEFVVAEPPNRTVRYRFYVHHEDDRLLDDLERRIRAQEPAYPVSLGPAFCLAWLNIAEEESGEDELESARKDEIYRVVTVIPQRDIEKVEMRGLERTVPRIKMVLEENLPPDLGPGRMPSAAGGGSCLVEVGGRPLPVRLREGTEVFRVGELHGVFL